MNGHYTIFHRDPQGIRGQAVPNFSKLVITQKWLQASKFKAEGLCTGTVPFEDGDQILIYRNGVHFMSGIVEKIETQCDNPDSDVREWIATGRDLSMMFEWRQVLADPLEVTFEDNTFDRIEDTAWNRLLHYIRNSYGSGTIWGRQIYPLLLPDEEDLGEVALSAYKNQKLSQVLEEIGENDDLVPVLDQDDKTGRWSVDIAESRDMTKSVYFSPAFGNILKWKRASSIPECNTVWVFSGDYSQGRLYVFAEDAESIEQYGRIEKIVSMSDIAPWEPPEEEEEEEEEEEQPEEPAEGEEEEEEVEEVHLTEEDVIALLETEAQNQLRDNQRKLTWTVEAAETMNMAFMDQWMIGDKVTCILDGQRFTSQITKIKITYEKGTEKVEPTIGDVENGLFGEIIAMIHGLDKRIAS